MACSRTKGFTLIELLVTLALISILVAAALTSFNEILQQQKISQAAAQVKNDLRAVQNRAISGINQDLYSGWGLIFTDGGIKYSLCGKNEAGCAIVTLVSLPQGTEIKTANPATVTFQAITGEPTSVVPATIKVGLVGDSDQTKWKTVTVSSGGNIE